MRKTEVENKKAPRGGDKYNIKTWQNYYKNYSLASEKQKKCKIQNYK